MSLDEESVKFAEAKPIQQPDAPTKAGIRPHTSSSLMPSSQSFPGLSTTNEAIRPCNQTPYRDNLLKLHSRLASHQLPSESKPSIPTRVSNSLGASLALQKSGRERDLKRTLEIEYHDLSDKINALNNNLVQLGRRKANLKHDISDINAALNSQRSRLDCMLQAAKKSINHAKQMSETHLDEFLLTLENLYATLKFNLNEQVASARDFHDEELVRKARELEDELMDLAQKGSVLRQDRENAIKKESEALKTELDQHIRIKQEQCNALDKQFQQSETAYAKASANHASLAQDVSILENQCTDLEHAVESIESRLASHDTTRDHLQEELLHARKSLNAARRENELVSEDFDASSASHHEFESRFHQYESHRQILENSIMDLEALPRVYVRGDLSAYPFAAESFNKVFHPDTSDVLLAHEYKHLVGSCARGNSVSLIYVDYNKVPANEIVQCYEHLRANSAPDSCITLQCFSIKDGTLTDSLNQGKSVLPETLGCTLEKLPLQAMIVGNDRGSAELLDALRKYGTLEGNSTCGYILQIKEPGLKGSVLFVTLSDYRDLEIFRYHATSAPNQMLPSADMGTTTAIVSRIARYALYNTRCLFMVDLTMSEPLHTLETLSGIRQCKSL